MIKRDLTIEMRWLGWLSGLMEGEGTFVRGSPAKPRRPCAAIGMADEDIVQRVCDLWGTRLYNVEVKNPKHRPVFRTELVGGSAVSLMKALRPWMGLRRQSQIDEAVASYTPLRIVKHKRFALVPAGFEEFARYWLAGYLEGEGSFGCSYANTPNPSPLIEVSSVDADVIEHVHRVWIQRYDVGVNIHVRPPRREGYQRQYHLAAHGVAARAIMADIAPLLGARRQARIAEVLGVGGGPRRAAEARGWYDVRRAA